jgi:hypothetical protein
MNKFLRDLPTVEVEGLVYDPKLKKKVIRHIRVPIDPDKMISTREQFELAYLRWRYFMRVENPPEELVKQYEKAAYMVARDAYRQNQDTMLYSGLELEDVMNISLVHLVSYLGCYSLQFSDIGKKKVANKRAKEEYSEEEVKRKDLSNMIVFIQQRMKDLVRVFKQKNRNIMGEKHVAVLYQLIDVEIPCSDEDLLKSPHRYGYRRVPPSQYNEIKRKLGRYPEKGKFSVGDIKYRYVSSQTAPVWIEDYENYESLSVFNQIDKVPPQEEQFELLKRYRMERLLDRYEKAPKKLKIKMLKRVEKILSSKGMNKELELARRILGKLNSSQEL